MYIWTCYIKIWGTSGFCTWPYIIYCVHNPSWEYYSKAWVELSSKYADDTQLYISFQPGVSVSKDIKIWMTNNLLKLNDDKTELIVITTHSNTSQNQHVGINIGDSLIAPSREPSRNLQVLYHSTCSLNDYVSKICKSTNYNLHSIGKIRIYLDTHPNCWENDKLFYNITPGLM